MNEKLVPESEAIDRVAAAAPDLLHVLKRVRRGYWRLMTVDMVADIDAAIAKATGATHEP